MPWDTPSESSWSEPSVCSGEISAVHLRAEPPLEVAKWLNHLGKGGVPLLTIEAPENHRQEIYSSCASIDTPKWRVKGVRSEVVGTTLHVCDSVVSQLLQVDTLLIEEPLKSMVDRKFYLVSDLFRAILEARFQVTEGADPSGFVTAIIRWMLDQKLGSKHEKFFASANVSRRVTPTEQLDLLFFLVTLAFQSGIINHLTLALDRVEMAATTAPKNRRVLLKELEEVAFGATRWERLGSPFGIMIGVDRLAHLEFSAPKLSKLLRSGVLYQPSV